jgi:spore germination protein YaaH
MALIDPGNPVASQSTEEIRRDYLTNLIINREAVQRAIFELTKTGVKSFTLDTGQNSQTVTRQDLDSLRQMLKTLNDLITEEESALGIAEAVPGQLIQAVPW